MRPLCKKILVILCLTATFFLPREGRCNPIEPGTAIAGAALAMDLLVGINKALTTAAQVDARTSSAGPDDDDLGSRVSSDRANTPFEGDLDAWTTKDTGGINLGPNPEDPHAGFARMHLDFEKGSWNVVPGERYALASAQDDTTPVKNADNTTAVGSVATFAHGGTIVTGYTKLDADTEKSVVQQESGQMSIALQGGEVDIIARSSAALVWTPNAFTLSETNGSVTVTPPVESVSLFHNFVQLESSPNFGQPFMTGVGVPDLSPLLNELVTPINASVSDFLGTVPFASGSRADFTLTGVNALFDPEVISRGNKTDREVIEEYLLSSAVSFVAPDTAQSGFEVDLTSHTLLGGSHNFMPGTLLANDGGFGTPDPLIDGPNRFNLGEMVGFVVESEGSLLSALNLAAGTPGSSIANLLGGLNPGDKFQLPLVYNASGEAYDVRARNVAPAAGAPEPSTLLLLGSGLGAIVLVGFRRKRF